MSSASIQIDVFKSFQELTDEDKQRCMDSYINEPLQPKHIQNKYLKRTEYIVNRPSGDTECFLAFDVCPVNFKYSCILFTLCGIAHHFQYVIYMSIIEDAKLDSVDKFLCDLLANIIIVDIPKCHETFTLKFVLCRDNPLNVQVLDKFYHSKRTSKLSNTFPVIRERTGLRQSKLLDPYVQIAWMEILQGNISQATVSDLFRKHRELAEAKKNEELLHFLEDYSLLARDLLESNVEINLRLCTMERMDQFQQIILAHMKYFREEFITRAICFNLIRAVMHIYGL